MLQLAAVSFPAALGEHSGCMPNGIGAMDKDEHVHEKKRKTPSPVPNSPSPINGGDEYRSKTSSPVSLH